MIEKPIRKYLKQKDYQKHKILRRIKKRNQRRKEAASKIAERALRKKLKLPAFDGGKDEDELLIGGYVAPELIVTPEGNAFRTTESGQPAVSTGALLEAGIPIRRKSKELKNNQKLLGHDEYLAQLAAADEIAKARTDGLNEMFADLLTAGFASLMAKGGEQLRNGDYVRGAINMASPLMLGSGVVGDAARALFGGWHLADDDGVRKTWNHLLNGEYGRAALSGTGDLLNAVMLAYGVNQLGRAARPVWNAGKEAVYNVADRYMFMPRKDSFTRGIGGETGLQDLVESGLVRGNPVGTEVSANMFGKMYRRNRWHFRDIMNATGREGIAQRYFNRTLSEEDFNAIKKAAERYVKEYNALPEKKGIYIAAENPDPLEGYLDYNDYKSVLSRDKQTLARATSMDDSGQPLAYFYDDGRNPLTAGHDYARSDYGVRINNASGYNPRIFSGHLHYSMPEAVSLRDPNVEIFKKGPLGLTIKLDKKTLQPVWKRDLSNMFRRGETAKTPQITAENAASMTPEQWTAAQDAAIARGDMAEAQRLRDLHSSLTDSATPGKYYRGTQTRRNSYPDRHIDEEVGEMNGIYLTKRPKYAKTYGDVEEFYLRSNNPLETEGNWTGVIDDATRAEIENAGYDAVVNNRFDTGFLNKLLRNSRDETITFDGKNLKSTNAVTYDDNGVRIPLGERDNFNINDIRYGLIPFGVGLTGYGLYNSVTDPINLSYNKGKDPIHIKPSKRGTFTAAAKKRGMGVLLFASKVLRNPSNYSLAMRKKALFAKNATKFKH